MNGDRALCPRMAWFVLLFLAFVKIFPSVSMYEIKEMLFEHREVSDRLVRETPPQPAVSGAPHGQTA